MRGANHIIRLLEHIVCRLRVIEARLSGGADHELSYPHPPARPVRRGASPPHRRHPSRLIPSAGRGRRGESASDPPARGFFRTVYAMSENAAGVVVLVILVPFAAFGWAIRTPPPDPEQVWEDLP